MLSEKADGKMAKAGLLPAIKPGDHVLVSIHKNGYWVRNSNATVVRETDKRYIVDMWSGEGKKAFSKHRVRLHPNP